MTSLGATTLPRYAPFDAVAEKYDQVWTNSLIGKAQRGAVWREMDAAFQPGDRVLELNCGTGVDAIHLAERGVEVFACDASYAMIDVARRRLASSRPAANVQFSVLAIEDIALLASRGSFDGAFSNFAGLNCVQNLPGVARDLARLLKPGATALLCLAGRVALWEILWYMLHGKPRKALRRIRRGGAVARLAADSYVKVHYATVGQLKRIFAPEFRLKRWTGVGISVPPSYLEPLAQRFPKTLKVMERADHWLACCPALRGLADHVLLNFERV